MFSRNSSSSLWEQELYRALSAAPHPVPHTPANFGEAAPGRAPRRDEATSAGPLAWALPNAEPLRAVGVRAGDGALAEQATSDRISSWSTPTPTELVP